MSNTEEAHAIITTNITILQEDEMALDITRDIRNAANYQTRNRTIQLSNPFFITKKGTFMAGILMANTPGENKKKQINYLAHTLKLAKEDKNLINTDFINGNFWFTIHFKLQLDLTNFMEKINNKSNEDFRFFYIKGG